MRRFIITTLLLSCAAFAQDRLDRWAAVLQEEPVVKKVSERHQLMAQEGLDAKALVLAKQTAVRSAIEAQQVKVFDASQTLVNAIYFTGNESEAARVRSLPGVAYVTRLRAYKALADDKAVQLVQAPQAWNSFGGPSNAGAGRRIGIIDSGIDQTHPALIDESLTPPEGFPRGSDLGNTSKKVIVARSYVNMIAAGEPSFSRPDDLSARDRSGHGTAVAVLAAGFQTSGPAATIYGTAPKAFLGNYKIFGSPGVNDITFDNAIVKALEDALVDGMDVVTLSLGHPASWGPYDTGNICGKIATDSCDFRAAYVNYASSSGMAVVVAAGNSGDDGFNYPALGSINTPGTAPAAITVGAFTNAHVYQQTASVEGATPGSPLNQIDVRFGSGPVPQAPLVAPGISVTSIGDNGKACRPLGNNTLNGYIVIIQRGDCLLETKIIYAQRAGAVGVIIEQYDGYEGVFPAEGLSGTGIPAVIMGSANGKALREFLFHRRDALITLNPAFRQKDAPADEIAYFSSRGPALGTMGIKPELTAPGTDLYTATQSYDPNSGLYSSDRFLSVQGTSFAAPFVAGAAAMVKQKNPGWAAAHVKSALVNSANPNNIIDFDSNGTQHTANVSATGAGKLDAAAALNATITASPATISFGVLNQGFGDPQGLLITNTTNNPVNLNIAVQPREQDGYVRVVVSQPSFSLAAGQTTQLAVRVEGQRYPNPGSYTGFLIVSGSGPEIRIPYQYLMGDGVPHNIYPLTNNGFIGTPGRVYDRWNNPFLAKVTDQYGAPVVGANVRWQVISGSGHIQEAAQQTDVYGIADAGIQLGPELGEQAFQVEIGNLRQIFNGRTILQPTIRTDGVQDAANGLIGEGLAPGSYISIYGSGLSETTKVFSTGYLPLSLANVSVSFDVPSAGISVPGRIHFVSDGQVNVQIPWELQGQTFVQMKVSIGDWSSAVYTVPLNEYSPGVFEYDDATSGHRLAAALDQNNQVITGVNPVGKGDIAQLFINGLGRTSSQPASGEASPGENLAYTQAIPTVTIGGHNAPVQFSGLAPGLVGLYQVNVRIPVEAPSGIQQLNVSIGGVGSQNSQIAVK